METHLIFFHKKSQNVGQKKEQQQQKTTYIHVKMGRKRIIKGKKDERKGGPPTF